LPVLEEMRIRGLGVIEDATLEFGPGLTVVTGETGAGKTMVVSGLALLLGERADAGVVRSGTERASIEGRLRLAPDAPALRRALDAGAEVDDDGTLIVARTVAAEGRSRAHLGGRSVPVGVLAELADDLLALHGQSGQLALLRPTEQRSALDRYAGAPVGTLLDRYRETFAEWRELAADLDDRLRRTRERRQEADLLRHGLAEIAEVDPQPAEDTDLDAESRRLANVDELRIAAETAHQALASDATSADAVDASTLVGAARRALGQTDDPALTGLHQRLAEVATLLTDITAELASYVDQLDADPTRLAVVETRRAALKTLTRKYAEDVDGVLAWAEQATGRLAELDTSDEAIAALTKRRDVAGEQTAEVAARLTAARSTAARRFAKAVTAELAGLAMPDASIEVSVTPKPAEAGGLTLTIHGSEVAAGPDGADDIAIALVPHRGAPARPLQRSASGGELSRVMLAVEVVFAGADPVPTMVFDEVDAGVGGKAAAEVGRRLAALARDHQVIVVTHLPQVAAYADRHLVVDKDRSGAVTRSGVHAVAESERARELARMLAGLADSELGQAHAEELLATAAAHKNAAHKNAAHENAAHKNEGPTGKPDKAASKTASKPTARAATKTAQRRRTA
jgi:DNA repair protein RecN (Recombination protein N)